MLSDDGEYTKQIYEKLLYLILMGEDISPILNSKKIMSNPSTGYFYLNYFEGIFMWVKRGVSLKKLVGWIDSHREFINRDIAGQFLYHNLDKEIENYTSYSANHIKLIVFCYNNNIDFSSIKDPNIFWRTAKEEIERKNGISINLRTMTYTEI